MGYGGRFFDLWRISEGNVLGREIYPDIVKCKNDCLEESNSEKQEKNFPFKKRHFLPSRLFMTPSLHFHLSCTTAFDDDEYFLNIDVDKQLHLKLSNEVNSF